MAFDLDKAAYAGLAGVGAGSLMGGYKNPAKAANGFMDQIPDELKKYMQPYMDAGTNSIGTLNHNYDDLLNHPGDKVNEIGSSYHQSPGFQFALQQALQGGDHSAAAGGMAGSPMHEQENMTLATNLGNQDYNNYLQNALGLYGKGLSGQENMFNTGASTSQSMSEDLASTLAQKAKLAYEGQNAENEHNGGSWGSLLGGATGLLGGLGKLAFL